MLSAATVMLAADHYKMVPVVTLKISSIDRIVIPRLRMTLSCYPSYLNLYSQRTSVPFSRVRLVQRKTQNSCGTVSSARINALGTKTAALRSGHIGGATEPEHKISTNYDNILITIIHDTVLITANWLPFNV